jgi:membrane protein
MAHPRRVTDEPAEQRPAARRPRRLPPPVDLLWEAVQGWSSDDVPRLGASLAYYTLFAVAPILLISITIAGAFFGQEAVRGQIGFEIERLVGADGARAIEALLAAAHRQNGGPLALVVGAITLLMASTGAFLELQHALNKIFRVKQKAGVNIKELLRRRARSFGLVVSIGFLLMVSLTVSAALAALSRWVHGGETVAVLWQAADMVVSLGVITLLFALIYRFLPDVRLHWRDVWTGAFATAVLFTAGKYLIGLYLGRTSVASSYGAVGSIVVLLVWVYYSAQVMLLGAEITRVYAERRRHGRNPGPDGIARRDPAAHPSVS